MYIILLLERITSHASTMVGMVTRDIDRSLMNIEHITAFLQNNGETPQKLYQNSELYCLECEARLALLNGIRRILQFYGELRTE